MHVRAARTQRAQRRGDQGGPAADRDLLRRARRQHGVPDRAAGARRDGRGLAIRRERGDLSGRRGTLSGGVPPDKSPCRAAGESAGPMLSRMTDPADARTPPGDQFVQSLARGLAVITAFDADHPAMTLSDIAARTGLTRATARRFLHTLVELGYVRIDGKQFALTARCCGSVRVPLRAGAAADRPAAPRAAVRAAGGVDVGGGAGRGRDRLRRPGGDPADHDGRDHGRDPVPGVRDLDGAGAARGAPGGGARRLPAAAPRSGPLTRRAIRDAATLARRAGPGPRAGLGAGRPGARARAALGRGAGAGRWDRVVAAVNVSTSTQLQPELPDGYVDAVVAAARAISEDLASAGLRV